MVNHEKRRKLKQAYELMSLANELIESVILEMSSDEPIDEVTVVFNDLGALAADLSGFAVDHGPLKDK